MGDRRQDLCPRSASKFILTIYIPLAPDATGSGHGHFGLSAGMQSRAWNEERSGYAGRETLSGTVAAEAFSTSSEA